MDPVRCRLSPPARSVVAETPLRTIAANGRHKSRHHATGKVNATGFETTSDYMNPSATSGGAGPYAAGSIEAVARP
jgi:hypothetical protein